MINTHIDIPSIEQTIIRPTIVGLMQDLNYLFKIDTHIRTDIQNEIHQLAKIESFMNKPISYRYGHEQNTYIDVSYTEETNDNRIMTNQLYRGNTSVHILNDVTNNVIIKPIYYFTDLKINITYKTKSQNDIHRFINNLKMLFIKNRETHYHKIIYHIHIPRPIKEFLEVIYDIQIDKNVIDKEFTEYIFDIGGTNLTLASNQSKHTILSYKDIQSNAIGMFSTDLTNPEMLYDKDTGYYSVNIEYQVSYNKPIYLYIQYPELICNTVLPSKYILQKDYYIEYNKVIVSDYLRVPKWDNNKITTLKPHMVIVFSVLVIPSNSINGLLCNLNELIDFELDPSIRECLMNGEYQHILKPYDSIIHIEFYGNDRLLDNEEWLEINSDLDISLKKDIDITKNYRIVLLVVDDYSYLSNDAKKRIKECEILGELFKILIDGKEYILKEGVINRIKTVCTIYVNSILRYTG